MTDRPIIFSGPMVRALLAGRKTQTRRILRLPPAPEHLGEWEASTIGGAGVTDSRGNPVPEQPCAWHTRTGATVVPRYQVGDRLYWQSSNGQIVLWQAHAPTRDDLPEAMRPHYRLRPCIHLPRELSRLTLIVEAVKVEQLQTISEADAIAEGIERYGYGSVWGWIDYAETNPNMTRCFGDPRASFRSLWESLHGADGWVANPFTVALTFRVEHSNIDRITA